MLCASFFITVAISANSTSVLSAFWRSTCMRRHQEYNFERWRAFRSTAPRLEAGAKALLMAIFGLVPFGATTRSSVRSSVAGIAASSAASAQALHVFHMPSVSRRSVALRNWSA